MASLPLAADGHAEIATVSDDLVRDTLRILLPVTLFVMWGWASAAMVLDEGRIFFALFIFALVALGCWVGYSQREQRLRVAVGGYLGILAASLTVMALVLPGATALYLYLLLVLITAVLASPRVAWGVAGASVLLVAAVGAAKGLGSFWDVATPILLILMTALTSWLSARRLYTALDWALQMTHESRKNAEEARGRRAEVRSILKSLEESYVRLERANQALIFAREAAEKAYRFKAEFVANVSHELRTPLNLIVGFSEMMATAPESYKGRPLPSQYRGDVMAIYRSARHLSNLIDDVLDLSQIEAGRLPITREETDLGEIIREAADLVRGLAQAKGLRVIIDLPPALPPLMLDRTRIRQVLLNLLSNATRFTDEGFIRVRACSEGQEVRVMVEDSGRGIAPDRLRQAFEAFSQLDDDQARQGTGLGLAISRSFVELHGGTMWIESKLGEGTTVGLSLPLGQEGPAPDLIRTRAVAYGPGDWPPVLVLHDDPHALALLRRYVEGFRFALAGTVERAAELLRQGRPLAVIMESAWAARWAQLAADLRDPPPVITCPLPSLRQAGLLLGAVDYLAKPLRREDLLAALARLPQPPRTVLVVDDDPNFARLLARMLRADGGAVEVLMASGGEEGLEVARSRRPDLVLLDLLMPGVSGYDFLAEVEGDPALAGMAVIILSACSFELEAKPLPGALRLERAGGLSLTELVQSLQALLTIVTGPAAVAQASAEAPVTGPPA